MARFHSLFVHTLARENVRKIAQLTERMHDFGDLVNRMRRAAISVVSNICEGASTGSDRQFARNLTIARASAGASWPILLNWSPITRSTTAAITSGGRSPSCCGR